MITRNEVRGEMREVDEWGERESGRQRYKNWKKEQRDNGVRERQSGKRRD